MKHTVEGGFQYESIPHKFTWAQHSLCSISGVEFVEASMFAKMDIAGWTPEHDSMARPETLQHLRRLHMSQARFRPSMRTSGCPASVSRSVYSLREVVVPLLGEHSSKDRTVGEIASPWMFSAKTDDSWLAAACWLATACCTASTVWTRWLRRCWGCPRTGTSTILGRTAQCRSTTASGRDGPHLPSTCCSEQHTRALANRRVDCHNVFASRRFFLNRQWRSWKRFACHAICIAWPSCRPSDSPDRRGMAPSVRKLAPTALCVPHKYVCACSRSLARWTDVKLIGIKHMEIWRHEIQGPRSRPSLGVPVAPV